MSALSGFAVLWVTLMLQIAVASRLPLLAGTADLMMLVLIAWALQEQVKNAWWWTLLGGLMVGIVSAMPLMMLSVSYVIIVGLARLLRLRVWQAPIFVMFFLAFAGTIIQHTLSIITLQLFKEITLPLAASLNYVVLPSVLLNLMLSFPVYSLVSSVANWIYPPAEEVVG